MELCGSPLNLVAHPQPNPGKSPDRQGAPNSPRPGRVNCVPRRGPGRGLQGERSGVSGAAICRERGWLSGAPVRIPALPTPGFRTRSRDSNGQAGQTGWAHLRNLLAGRQSYPKRGPGQRRGSAGRCTGSSASKKRKLRPSAATCLLPSSLPLLSTLLFLLRLLPSPLLTEMLSPPRVPIRPADRSGLLPSVARYRGGGVLPERWLGEKMGCPRPGEKTQRERDGSVTSETRVRIHSPHSGCF